MPDAQPPAIPLSRSRQTFSIIWALTPLVTFGIGTVLVIGSAAVRLARRREWIAAAGYFAAFIAIMIAAPGSDHPPSEDLRDNVAMTLWFGIMWLGGTLHAFLLRTAVFRPQPSAWARTQPPSAYGGFAPPQAPSPWTPERHPVQPSPPGAFSPPQPQPPTAPRTQSPWAQGGYPEPRTQPSPTPGRSAASWATASAAPRRTDAPTWDPYGTGESATGFGGSSASGPRMVGPYVLGDKVGEGGQGSVYTGTTREGRQVAIKILHERFRGGTKEREDFMREVAAARRVPQFSTARTIDVGVTGDTAYIVSEYVPGPSLERLVREQGRLDGDSLTRLAIATSAALNAIHSAGIVHRDFKPANVLLGPDGPRVIDFGIAKALDQVTMTTGGLKGTPAYMSPEQVAGTPVGPESDIFSWAGTMFFGATGHTAFGGTTAMQVFYAILNHQPDLSVLPPSLRAPIAACFDKNPRSRPTAAQLMVAIAS